MNEISKERIEISGVEYTLFLNRKGVSKWEKYAGNELLKMQDMKGTYETTTMSDEIPDGINPFADIDKMEEDVEIVMKAYKKLFWLMLYNEHELDYSVAGELYDKACEEYGADKVIALEQQMFEDVQINKISKTKLKNLPALRPKKK